MKKVAILGLHLGFGGVEQAIVNEANMLCDNYNVEIVSIYKVVDEIPFNLDERVKVVYLNNLKPNREEFLDYWKNKKILKMIKEGFKSLYILYKKKSTMRKYIRESNADVMISSRLEITNILRKYKKTNVVTIAEEHRHHNGNKKYIKDLVNSLKGIDYLRCVSKELTNFYSKIVKNTKCIYIPNALEYNVKEKSKLNNNKLVAVGRLSPEKGFIDLIDVFNIMYSENQNISLDIVGDGIERKNIMTRIKSYGLDEAITLHGFQSKKNVNKCLKNSSLYMMTSFEESFGTVLIEAASFGIPSLAFSSAQGANEIIKNNETGFLIENRDKRLMAQKALNLLADRQLLKALGNNAYNNAQNYTFDNVKKKWLSLMKDKG